MNAYENIQQKVKQLLELEEEITKLANSEPLKDLVQNVENCPLNHDGRHYSITEKLFGSHWFWRCPICGTRHSK